MAEEYERKWIVEPGLLPAVEWEAVELIGDLYVPELRGGEQLRLRRVVEMRGRYWAPPTSAAAEFVALAGAKVVATSKTGKPPRREEREWPLPVDLLTPPQVLKLRRRTTCLGCVLSVDEYLRPLVGKLVIELEGPPAVVDAWAPPAGAVEVTGDPAWGNAAIARRATGT